LNENQITCFFGFLLEAEDVAIGGRHPLAGYVWDDRGSGTDNK